MRIRKIYVLSLACLLVLSLCMLTAGSAPASAQRARPIWPFHYFAPYSYDASSQTDLVALARASDTRFFTLAFIANARGRVCQASWNSRQPVGPWMRASINALRTIGGDVSVAFGGADLAGTCPTLESLQAQYRLVVEAYNLTHLDFDIEGRNLADARVNQLRNRAVASLQREFALAGRRLVISYTLPTNVTGLTPAGVNLLRDALQAGVHLAGINLMTMNYYSPRAPGDEMAQNAIRTVNSVVQQLHLLYPNRTAAQLWGMLGITPMIGVNNDLREIFTLQDARTLLSFAEQRHIARLAFWSIQRDDRCERGEVAPHHCSGVPQQPYQYARTFSAFDL
jgi:chitinase